MNITGVSLGQFTNLALDISMLKYGNNIRVAGGSHDRSNGHGSACTARISVIDSHGPGSRLTVNGRAGPYACWHAYRDVLHELFARYRNARVTTGMARYNGASGFADAYPATAIENIGSETRPAFMPDLCQCSHKGMPAEYARLSRPAGTFAPYLVTRQSPNPPRPAHWPELPAHPDITRLADDCNVLMSAETL